MTTDIIERLCMPTAYGDAQRREAAAEIKRLRNDYHILKRDYDALREVRENEGNEIERLRRLHRISIDGRDEIERGLREDNEHLRTTLGYLADNIDNPALVAVADAALKPKP